MWVMQTYLTNVWKLSVTHAAGIINVWNGVTFFLMIPFSFFADSILGNLYTLLFSGIVDTIVSSAVVYVHIILKCVCLFACVFNACIHIVVVKEVLIHYLGAGVSYRVNTTVQHRAM